MQWRLRVRRPLLQQFQQQLLHKLLQQKLRNKPLEQWRLQLLKPHKQQLLK